MKWLNYTLALLFTLFAAAQMNDPDPWGWVALYGVVAVQLALAARRTFYPFLLYATLVAALLWWGMLWPDFIQWLRDDTPSIVSEMKAEAPHIELTREFLGLLLALLAIGYLLWQERRSRV